MAGITLCEPTRLYNILNQSYDCVYANVSDAEYLLLIDAREWKEYSEDHIVLAQRARKDRNGEYQVPYGADVETKLNVIVYDSNTSLLTDKGPAIQYAKLLASSGSQRPVNVLKGGYELFSARYPFLRTHQILYTDKDLDKFETCPIEILPQMLYLGREKQAVNSHLMTKMKITGMVCCKPQMKSSSLPQFHVPVTDSADSNIIDYIEKSCDFIGKHLKLGGRVLIYGEYGRSRSATIVVAFLMKHNHWSLELAYSHTLKCSENMRPQRSFVHQLSEWEKTIFGDVQTDISDPNY
ncbi:serine/threonine/tyrosine-interacting-like protein 1 [Corticium candelabrum]|uniref:serine/threonine/tyrosine-interacting-like protein 1 n=1 Tax=Corticium candelabrum TaxID=121492 RepID=UPI002E263B81|nr:serine/threonine/tyrosine-interacting-like protein 1 [Corticium candelabrum]